MQISVTAPVEKALNHTKAILFDDFRFKMWLGLGFCSFLANGIQLPTGGNWGDSLDSDALGDWVKQHVELSIVGGIAILMAFTAVSLLMLWLISRGKFMFMDGVLNNSGAVKGPWRQFKFLGNNLFLFQLVLGFIFAFTIALTLGATFLGFSFIADAFGDVAGGAVGILGISGFTMAVVVAIVLFLVIEDFLVPIMYRRNMRALDALGLFRREIMIPYSLKFFLYLLMRFLLAMASGILVLIGVCVTCCFAAIPYVSSVVFLPIAVFFRLYSIYFLEQFGPEWWFFAREGTDGPDGGSRDSADRTSEDPDPLDAIMNEPDPNPYGRI